MLLVRPILHVLFWTVLLRSEAQVKPNVDAKSTTAGQSGRQPVVIHSSIISASPFDLSVLGWAERLSNECELVNATATANDLIILCG